ncbi:MAG: APC family permease, partial [Acidimicrobiales bacterium]
LAFYPIMQIFSLVIFGAFVSQILAQHAGLNIQWWLITVVGLLLIWVIAYLGIKLSVRTDLAFLAFEAIVLIALAVTIIVKGGAHGAWHPGLFTPQGIKVSGIALGVVFGVLGFTGFEAAAYLGEESHSPRQTIPRAIIITTLITGVVYVVFAYVATIGWGAGEMTKYGQNAAPWDVLAGRYWNSGSTIVVDIAAAIAVLAGGLAAQNGGARMVFALARDGLLPKPLSRVSRRFGTPEGALGILLVLAVAVSLGLGLAYGPLTAFGLLTLLVTFAALAVYFLVQVACIAYFWKRKEFNVFWHGVLPVVAMALIAWLFVKSEVPAPAYPQNLAFWIALAWTGLGLLIVAGMSVWAPLRFQQLAQILGEEEPGALLPTLESENQPGGH